MHTLDRKDTTHSTRIGAFTLSLVLGLGSVAAAGPSGSSALVTPHANRLEPYRFFGERTATVSLLLHTPQAQGITVRAQLMQVTSRLAAPIGAPLDVPLPAEAASPEIEIELVVPLPAVKRETGFELRFQSRRDRDGPWYAAGRIPLRVYPSDLIGPIRTWATSHPLRVKDDQGSLVEFLRQQRVPIVGGDSQGFRDGRGVTLYAGAHASRRGALVPLRRGDAIVFFTERETEPPRLLIERTGGGTAVTVEMRLLDRLATDPLAQKIFLEVFEVINDEKQSMGGNDR